jgi:UDP-glucuronate decarboxylase
MRELGEKVIGIIGARLKIIHLPLSTDDPKQCRPDIAMAIGELDWHPKLQLKFGLRNTIAYFDQLLRLGSASFAAGANAQ